MGRGRGLVTVENDRTALTRAQGRWLESALASSTAAFNVVYMHHCPYSSAAHGDQVRRPECLF